MNKEIKGIEKNGESRKGRKGGRDKNKVREEMKRRKEFEKKKGDGGRKGEREGISNRPQE